MATPTETNWIQALHVLRYMYHNRFSGIHYKSDDLDGMTAFYDASFNPDPKDSKVHYGWCIMLAGGCLAWSSHKLPYVSRSIMEAEYCATRPAADMIIFYKKLAEELQMAKYANGPVHRVSTEGELVNGILIPFQGWPILVHGDNDQATRLVKENRNTPATRSILREQHLAQECCTKCLITPARADTKKNPADLFTKAVDGDDFYKLSAQLKGYDKIDYQTINIKDGRITTGDNLDGIDTGKSKAYYSIDNAAQNKSPTTYKPAKSQTTVADIRANAHEAGRRMKAAGLYSWFGDQPTPTY